MALNLINSTKKRREHALARIKKRILKEVYNTNKSDQETPERAYDRAMKGI